MVTLLLCESDWHSEQHADHKLHKKALPKGGKLCFLGRDLVLSHHVEQLQNHIFNKVLYIRIIPRVFVIVIWAAESIAIANQTHFRTTATKVEPSLQRPGTAGTTGLNHSISSPEAIGIDI